MKELKSLNLIYLLKKYINLEKISSLENNCTLANVRVVH